METAEQATRPFRLMANLSPDGQADSVLPITWCLDRESVKDFKERGLKPYLLLVVSNNQQETDRHLVPVENQMAYIRFRRPGANVLHATLVWQKWGERDPKEVVLGKNDNGRYRADLIGSHRPGADKLEAEIKELREERDELQKRFNRSLKEIDRERLAELNRRIWDLNDEHEKALRTEEVFGIRRDFDLIERLDHEVELRVLVPTEMFAKEPPKWLKNLVGFFFKSKTMDQCHFRRRTIIAALLAPLYAVWLGVKELVILGSLGVLLILGMRGINFRPALNPIHRTPEDTWRRCRSSFWSESRDGENLSPFATFNPPVLMISYFVAFVVSLLWSSLSFPDKTDWAHFTHLWSGTWWFHLIPTLAPTAIAAVVLLGAGIVALTDFMLDNTERVPLANRVKAKLNTWRRERRLQAEREALEAKKAFYASLETMACNGDRKASLKELPKERRTLYLHYQAVKAAVCRPYAK